MKKIAILFTILATTAIIFSSCGKYEEGPSFSILTKKARVTGTWTVSEVLVNDQTQDISLFQGLKYELAKDGTGKVHYSINNFNLSLDLEWKFDDNKENLRIRIKDGNEWDEWETSEIIRLTNSELWIRDVETQNNQTITTITKFSKEK